MKSTRLRSLAMTMTAFVTIGTAAKPATRSAKLTDTTESLVAPAATADFNARLPFRLKAGDRVAFFGDSITHQDLYSSFVAQHYLNFRPDLHLEFRNAGVGGDKLQNGLDRIDRDLVPFDPTVIVCFFGMNDGCYLRPLSNAGVPDAFKTYRDNYKKMILKLHEKFPKARLCLFTTTCVDDSIRHDPLGYNDVLAVFSAFVQELGKTEKASVVDLYHPMLAAVERGHKAQPPYLLIPDAVHPNPAGHFVMAETILRAWGELK